MREFFRGWKRKAGVVTLGLACVFAAGWVRSLTTKDVVRAWGFYAVSNNGEFNLRNDDFYLTFWNSRPILPEPDANFGIPYWSIVIPLTLLSAYLLLSKPRQVVPQATSPQSRPPDQPGTGR